MNKRETKDTTFLTQIKPIERENDLSRIRKNVDSIFAKVSSATLLKRIRRQSDIVTNGKSDLKKKDFLALPACF